MYIHPEGTYFDKLSTFLLSTASPRETLSDVSDSHRNAVYMYLAAFEITCNND
jgi:hypothetical protein